MHFSSLLVSCSFLNYPLRLLHSSMATPISDDRRFEIWTIIGGSMYNGYTCYIVICRPVPERCCITIRSSKSSDPRSLMCTLGRGLLERRLLVRFFGHKVTRFWVRTVRKRLIWWCIEKSYGHHNADIWKVMTSVIWQSAMGNKEAKPVTITYEEAVKRGEY